MSILSPNSYCESFEKYLIPKVGNSPAKTRAINTFQLPPEFNVDAVFTNVSQEPPE